jgi:hypothetical protein
MALLSESSLNIGNVSRGVLVNTINTDAPDAISAPLEKTLDDFNYLMRLEGENARRHAVTANGDAKQDGSGNLIVDGIDDYLSLASSTDWNLAANDFSLGMGINPGTLDDNDAALITRSGSLNYMIYVAGSQLQFYASSDGGTWNLVSALVIGNLTADTWSDVLVTRSGNVYRTYLDGVFQNKVTVAGTIFNPNTQLIVGGNPTSGTDFSGKLRRVFVSNGFATQTTETSYTVETGPIEIDSSINLALDFGGDADSQRILDSAKPAYGVESPAMTPIIPDISGNEIDATQETFPAKQPEFDPVTNELLFDGSKEMTLAQTLNLPRYTIFAVYKPTAPITSSTNQCLLGPTGSSDAGLIYLGDATSRLTNETVSMLNANAIDTYGVGITDNIPAETTLMTFRLDGTAENIWINQTDKVLTVSTAGGLDSDGGLYLKDIGRLGSNNGLALINGNLSAIFIVDEAMSDEDVATIQQLIIDKYGVSV